MDSEISLDCVITRKIGFGNKSRFCNRTENMYSEIGMDSVISLDFVLSLYTY